MIHFKATLNFVLFSQLFYDKNSIILYKNFNFSSSRLQFIF